MSLASHLILQESARKLEKLLIAELEKELAGKNQAAVLFSGGIDSALLARLISDNFFEPKLYSVGFENSNDIKWSEEAAKLMGLDLSQTLISRQDLERALEVLSGRIGIKRPDWMTVFISLFLGFETVGEEDVVVLGQGADEIFGGYRKYSQLPEKEAEKMMASNHRMLADNEACYYHDIARFFGKSSALPYLGQSVADFGLGLHFNAKISDAGNKLVLRESGKLAGLPPEIYERPKKAMQYGTGVSRELKMILKEKGAGLHEIITAGT